MKRPLLDIAGGGALELSAAAVSFGAALTSAMTSNDHSAEEIRAVLDGALAAAGLADEDVAKAMLVQKAMTATGVTPEVMAQASDPFAPPMICLSLRPLRSIMNPSISRSQIHTPNPSANFTYGSSMNHLHCPYYTSSMVIGKIMTLPIKYITLTSQYQP